ncbi:hypothetical protein [Micromonospora polyrhachis]|uniref:Uncharacterized protein n=1 Tax=Micromonospora polyrhachis TaxID=1282883 RepID=A0A7W7SPQ4_9ACTN|nr:hypothetical protein [Micromonospora polyrhachis]MBB4958092.1 hypothetical protein [Micromonospora polyrhachis]
MASHLEFAEAGALGTKTVGSFAAGMRDLFAPEDVVAALVELSVSRTQAGCCRGRSCHGSWRRCWRR